MKKISAKKLGKLLAEVQVHNDSQLFRPVLPAPPVITHRQSDRHQYPRWLVWRLGYKTDPQGGHFLNQHNKVFPITAATTHNGQLIRAVEWASEKYGYTTDEWAKTPFGSWAPKDGLETALKHYLPELFADEVESHVAITTPDPIVKRITDKLYGEDPEWAESEPVIESRQHPIGDMGESILKAFDILMDESRTDDVMKVGTSSADADGWYRVLGANVVVFIQATSMDDAKNRMTHMINRITMDCALELHITKRDPEVN